MSRDKTAAKIVHARYGIMSMAAVRSYRAKDAAVAATAIQSAMAMTAAPFRSRLLKNTGDQDTLRPSWRAYNPAAIIPPPALYTL
jgi:hypothetical protein